MPRLRPLIPCLSKYSKATLLKPPLHEVCQPCVCCIIIYTEKMPNTSKLKVALKLILAKNQWEQSCSNSLTLVYYSPQDHSIDLHTRHAHLQSASDLCSRLPFVFPLLSYMSLDNSDRSNWCINVPRITTNVMRLGSDFAFTYSGPPSHGQTPQWWPSLHALELSAVATESSGSWE